MSSRGVKDRWPDQVIGIIKSGLYFSLPFDRRLFSPDLSSMASIAPLHPPPRDLCFKSLNPVNVMLIVIIRFVLKGEPNS